jgi:hypothetical protein
MYNYLKYIFNQSKNKYEYMKDLHMLSKCSNIFILSIYIKRINK